MHCIPLSVREEFLGVISGELDFSLSSDEGMKVERSSFEVEGALSLSRLTRRIGGLVAAVSP